MKKILPLGTLAFVCCAASLSAQILNTAWQSDYTGTEANTIALWKFDVSPYNQNSYNGAANPNAYPVTTMNVGTVTTGVAGKFGTGIALTDSVDSRGFSTE